MAASLEWPSAINAYPPVALQAANTADGKRRARNRQRHRCGKQHRYNTKQSEYIAIHEPVPRLTLIESVYQTNQGWQARMAALFGSLPFYRDGGRRFEEDGVIVFREACKLGCEGIVSEAAWLALPVGTLNALGEGQKLESAGRHAGSRGGLGPAERRLVVPRKTPITTQAGSRRVSRKH
jgi:hypothetical protein